MLSNLIKNSNYGQNQLLINLMVSILLFSIDPTAANCFAQHSKFDIFYFHAACFCRYRSLSGVLYKSSETRDSVYTCGINRIL